jgi:hypothetical protein
MFDFILPAADIALVAVLALALYFPRHRRKDLTVAYLAVNVGVLAVATALSAASVNAGLGLGLFGVLAIIRLRSAELDQHEIAYYFASLAMGVIGGLGADMEWAAVAFMVAVVAVVAVADAPGLFRRYRTMTIVWDSALADESELRRRVAERLGAEVVGLTTRRMDLVNDTTTIDVRYVQPKKPDLAHPRSAGRSTPEVGR